MSIPSDSQTFLAGTELGLLELAVDDELEIFNAIKAIPLLSKFIMAVESSSCLTRKV